MRQFTIKLEDTGGGRTNFFAYGAFEEIIKAGWCLRWRIEIGSYGEVVVFETADPTLKAFENHWPYKQLP